MRVLHLSHIFIVSYLSIYLSIYRSIDRSIFDVCKCIGGKSQEEFHGNLKSIEIKEKILYKVVGDLTC